MRTIGVDVSHWEGTVDWQTAAPTVGFAYYKCTEGTNFVDDQFQNNKTGCANNSVPSAPYHYWLPNVDSIQQANHFIGTAGLRYKRYIVDCEKIPDPYLAPSQMSAKILELLLKVEELTGIRPAIYTSPGFWDEYLGYRSWASKYDLLLARYAYAYNPGLPTGWTTWKVWQFTDHFYFRGCSEQAQGNWFNGTWEQCKEYFMGKIGVHKVCLPSVHQKA